MIASALLKLHICENGTFHVCWQTLTSATTNQQHPSHFQEARWTRMLYTSLAHTQATPTTSLRHVSTWTSTKFQPDLGIRGRLLPLTTTEENKSSGVTITVDTLNSSSYYLIFIFRFSSLKNKHPPGVVGKGHGGGVMEGHEESKPITNELSFTQVSLMKPF